MNIIDKKIHKYTDQKGNTHHLSDNDLKKAIQFKIELQKSTNGKCNWDKLCKMLQSEGIKAYKCENLRCLVKQYQSALNKLPNKEKYADMVSSSKLHELEKQVGIVNADKREVQNLQREFGKLRRYVTDTYLFQKELYEIAKENVHIDIPKIKKFDNWKHQNYIMVVTLTDLHIGALTDLPNSKYNSDLADFYLIQYANEILKMIEFYKPKTVYITNLGDMIEGSFMRYNQSFDIEMNQSQQQSTAIDYITSFISYLYKHTYERDINLKYTGIAGNHDRSNGNKKQNIDGDSFITVLNTVIKLMSEKMDEFEFIEPKTPSRTSISTNTTNIKLVHGDLDNLNKQDIISNFTQLDNVHYDLLIGGHKHSLMIKENNGIVIQSGSIVGNTQYSDSLGVAASRSQVVTMINESTGKITPIPIMLNSKMYQFMKTLK